tara:strand:- start:2881 stop:4206 length:1326 start_codon:yes stop_codon:yes gene_type:complete
MSKSLKIFNKIKPFDKIIKVDGDKSLSIRWSLIASQAKGKSKSYNLLRSEDVMNTLKCLKKLGIKIRLLKNTCEITGNGLNGFNYKKNIVLNAGNSGTLARLIMGLLVHSKKEMKIIGDNSLSKRDFFRITKPLKLFGAKFKTNSGKLPIKIRGTNHPKAIKYIETKGSAQIKSSIILAALNSEGTTFIKAKRSRNHTELLLKYLRLSISTTKQKNYDLIEINGKRNIKPFNYKIPSDISSAAFFMVLTTLSKNSKLKIKDVNLNPSRMGIVKILKMMGVKIKIQNPKIYKNEKIGDIIIKSTKNIKPINCPIELNSSAIDEFLLIFLVAAKAKGVSKFKKLSELNQKESPRLFLGSKILNKIGIKTLVTSDSIKIFGNPNLKIDKKIKIEKFLKDHRIFMTSVIAALVLGGNWEIHDKNCYKTSFPSFLKNIKNLGAKFT